MAEYRKAVLSKRIADCKFPKKYHGLIISLEDYGDYIEHENHSIEYVLEKIQLAIYYTKMRNRWKKRLDDALRAEGISPGCYRKSCIYQVIIDDEWYKNTIEQAVYQIKRMLPEN